MDDQLCDCCEGTQVLTPVTIINRPGLAALAYRVGTHARFFETMKAKLSSQIVEVPHPGDPYPLRKLATRAPDDPAIALLDGWATVADVLTFYQQRIANEGYLRTATERRSVLELGRLVGYALRPGVASTVYLAYTIDDNHTVPTEIPIGTRSQSVPNPGELPQTFETSDVLDARAGWNTLNPRLTRPQTIESIHNFLFSVAPGFQGDLDDGEFSQSLRSEFEHQRIFLSTSITVTKVRDGLWQIVDLVQHQSYFVFKVDVTSLDIYGQNDRVYLKGITTNLKPNDPLLIISAGGPVLFRIKEVKPDAAADRTLIIFQSTAGMPLLTGLRALAEKAVANVATSEEAAADIPQPVERRPDPLLNVIQGLSEPPSVPPANTLQLARSVKQSFAANNDSALQVVNAIRPDFKASLPVALSNVQVTPASQLEVYALRLKTGVYGSTAPLKPITDSQGKVIGTQEWPIDGTQTIGITLNFDSTYLTSATISVTAADVASTATISLENSTTTDTKLGQVDFHFDPTNSYPTNYHVKYNNDTVELTFNQVSGGLDVTIKIGGQESGPFTVADGETISVAVQSHTVKIANSIGDGYGSISVTDEAPLPPDPKNQIALDGTYDQIVPDSWYVILRPSSQQFPQGKQYIGLIQDAQTVAKTDYNFPAKVTQLTLNDAGGNPQDWLSDQDLLLSDIRSTTVFAQSESLELAEEPIDPIRYAICGGADNEIELDGLYTDLKSGRWLIVTGDRADIQDTSNNVVADLAAAELVMLAGVRHGYNPDLPGDQTHTFITLATKLSYCYRRDKVTIYGNVVKSTNGETRNELLGNGDGSRALQSFDLKQSPLTYVAAPNPSGVDSTLHVYVNDVEWHEADALAGLSPTDHKFITRTDDTDKTTVIFGTGQQGARPPTGAANVRAVYRNGIGQPGNVQANQISLLVTRPLGVKGVINPLRASGGADRESRDQARKNVPLAVTALDRLVSVQDYADFARTFAGIAKASARRLSDGKRELVHVTIAGVDDVPIDPSSDLYRNLGIALRAYGDPDLPIQVDVRDLLTLVISAKVYLQADYVWEKVVDQVKTKLLDKFSFDRRDLGQDAVLSEALSDMQAVPGVAYVDVDIFGAIPEKIFDPTINQSRLLTPQEITTLVQRMVALRPLKVPVSTKVDGLPMTPHGMSNLPIWLRQLLFGKQPLDRIIVELADFENGTLRPAQLAFLSPLVPDTLVLNRG